MPFNSAKWIAIIPARGGSKRIPQKNILDFFGKPMIAWTIEAALSSNIFDRVLVSTDSQEIANIAEAFGIQVPFLRLEYIDDHSPVSAATVSTLQQVKNILNESYDNVVQLMPNCPLRNSQDILNAYQNFTNSNTSSQISCFKYGWMNPWWAVTLNASLSPIPLFTDKFSQRSQDLPDLYCPSGAIWISKVSNLLDEKTFYSRNYTFFPMDWKSAIDIDNLEDLELAKAVFHLVK